jgi:general L-amino acid transport system permease protein
MEPKAFIRTAMLTPELPPLTERGAVKWMRENLFSGWFNTILTVLGLLAVFLILKASLPWWLNGVWNAASLSECRDIVAANAGEGASGACWAMIRERWHQFLFGFYPADAYWRPIMAFGLMFAALAPVLYNGQRHTNLLMIGIPGIFTLACIIALYGVDLHTGLAVLTFAALAAVAWTAPKQLLWFTILYPALAFFLLWGGSVWGPVSVIALVTLSIAAAITVARFTNAIWGLLTFVFIFILCFFNPLEPVLRWIFQIASLLSGADSYGEMRDTAIGWTGYVLPLQTSLSGNLAAVMPFGLPPVESDQFGGFLLAFVIGVTAISASLPLGILLALGRRSDMLIVKTLSVGFIEFIRGVPLITMLFTASLLLQYFLPPRTNFDLILRVIILVTLFASAYIAEVIRGGLAALPRGQYEAADALGLDYWKAQRLIIMPQALKVSIPGIVSSFIGLFKDTTLVTFVGLLDPLKGVTQIVRADINWKGIYWEPYIFVGAIFFVICFGMSRYSMYLEQKLKTDHR